MAVNKDPQGNEIAALHTLVDFKHLRVLEIGCGDGRLTFRYAGETAHVTGTDPDGESITMARARIPDALKNRVQFFEASIGEFAASFRGSKFDLALFSWSL